MIHVSSSDSGVFDTREPNNHTVLTSFSLRSHFVRPSVVRSRYAIGVGLGFQHYATGDDILSDIIAIFICPYDI